MENRRKVNKRKRIQLSKNCLGLYIDWVPSSNQKISYLLPTNDDSHICPDQNLELHP